MARARGWRCRCQLEAMSFALWWALFALPSGLWPSLGTSGAIGATHWWLQTPQLPGGRPQFTLQHQQNSLRYGAHPQGWAWHLQSKNLGIWWSPNRTLGVSAQTRGTWRDCAWDASAAWSPLGWTARAQTKGLSLVRSYQGQYGLGWSWDASRFEVQWGPIGRSLGIRHGDLEWRRSRTSMGTTDLLRLRHGSNLLEWRSSELQNGSQHQFGLRTGWGPSRLWVQLLVHGQHAQTLARLSFSQPEWGEFMLGFSPRQAQVRFQVPDQSPLRGSFVEWGSAATLNLTHRGRGITAIWNPYQQNLSVQIFARHEFVPKARLEPKKLLEPPVCWLDVTYSYYGQPPNVELELRGTSCQRVILIAQERQWKDHIPPGRYLVTGAAPKGWRLELPGDSLELKPNATCPIWISLVPNAAPIRWISASSAAAE